MRVSTEGKFFSALGVPFAFRGLDIPRGVEPPDPAFVRAAGFTVLRTDWPDDAVLERAAAGGARILARFDVPWAAQSGASRAGRRRAMRSAAARLRAAVRARADAPALLGVSLAGTRARDPAATAQALAELADVVHEASPGALVTVVDRWPGLSQCPPELDFLTVDVDLGRSCDLRGALSAAHRQVADRPLVLGEVRLREGAAETDLRRVSDAAVERGVAGTLVCSYGARPGRGGRPRGSAVVPGVSPPAVLEDVNRRDVRDLAVDWPAISVVVCAYNAEATLGECLAACDALDYPRLEVLVVDDGSTDATADIARAHPRVRLLSGAHAGLSAGRNVGWRAAGGELVAYLDSDAVPPPQWPWYLALGYLGAAPPGDVAGAGGPNVPPPGDPVAASVVALSPGGPLPQLASEDTALHLPGCNLGVRREVLERLGGFDEALRTASDDLELQWRIAEAGGVLGYHPAALVWHHRRPGLRPYLRQQRGYGRSQAVVEARYPHRFPRGYRFAKLRRLRPRRSVARAQGAFPLPAAYVSVLWRERALLDLAHQWGLPAATLLLATAPLGLLRRRLALPALAAGTFTTALIGVDALLAADGVRLPERSIRCRLDIAAHRVLRPLAFRWGHLQQRRVQRRGGRGG